MVKLAVDTRFNKLAVETIPVIEETYPAVPKPATVEVRFAFVTPPPLVVTKAPFNNKEPLLTVKKFCVGKNGSIKFKEEAITKPVLTRAKLATPP